MTLPVKSCGRKWIHTSHKWEQPAIGVDWDNLPKFHCDGISEGITEHEFLAGLPRSERVVVSAEEASGEITLEEANNQFARKFNNLRIFLDDPDNYTKHPNIEPSVPVAAIKRILEG